MAARSTQDSNAHAHMNTGTNSDDDDYNEKPELFILPRFYTNYMTGGMQKKNKQLYLFRCGKVNLKQTNNYTIASK